MFLEEHFCTLSKIINFYILKQKFIHPKKLIHKQS
jgi:hypothetical protein